MLYGTIGKKVSLRHLQRSFGNVDAVRNLSLDVEPGELVTVLGPSGCGKTTTLKMIAGLITSQGMIVIGDRRLDHLPPNKRNIGLVFQEYSLFPHLTVGENIAYGLRMRGWNHGKRKARVEEMLTLFRLEGLGDRKPQNLSGGQQQRVAVARALAFRPDLLLLDEPFSNLDDRLREEVRLDMRSIQRRTQQTTIFVTHDQDEALVMSDRIVLMNKGGIEQIDTPEQLYSMPATEFAASFIGVNNIIYGTYARHGQTDLVRIDGLENPLPVSTKSSEIGPSGSAAAACVRPEQIVVRPQNSVAELKSAWPRAFVANGRIIDIIFHGSSIILHLAVTGLPALKCERPAVEVQGLHPGDHVVIGILDCHLIPRG